MEKLLITGSSGELGKAVKETLAGKYEIIGVDINPKNGDREVDLRHFGDIYRALDEIDYVVHAASLHGIDIRSRLRLDFFENNVKGTWNLVEAAYLQKVKKIIFVSTSSIYGSSVDNDSGEAWWLTESSNVNPSDVYDMTKLLGEEICQFYADRLGLPILIYRVARFYVGPNVSDFHLKKAYMGIDVDDVVEALELGFSSDVNKGVYNISSAQTPFDVKDVQNLFDDAPKTLKDRKPEISEFMDKNKIEFPQSIKKVICIDKAIKELGFDPKYSVEDILLSGDYKKHKSI